MVHASSLILFGFVSNIFALGLAMMRVLALIILVSHQLYFDIMVWASSPFLLLRLIYFLWKRKRPKKKFEIKPEALAEIRSFNEFV